MCPLIVGRQELYLNIYFYCVSYSNNGVTHDILGNTENTAGKENNIKNPTNSHLLLCYSHVFLYSFFFLCMQPFFPQK
jgi:hypothetical protein